MINVSNNDSVIFSHNSGGCIERKQRWWRWLEQTASDGTELTCCSTPVCYHLTLSAGEGDWSRHVQNWRAAIHQSVIISHSLYCFNNDFIALARYWPKIKNFHTLLELCRGIWNEKTLMMHLMVHFATESVDRRELPYHGSGIQTVHSQTVIHWQFYYTSSCIIHYNIKRNIT